MLLHYNVPRFCQKPNDAVHADQRATWMPRKASISGLAGSVSMVDTNAEGRKKNEAGGLQRQIAKKKKWGVRSHRTRAEPFQILEKVSLHVVVVVEMENRALYVGP